jgi:alpha-tubulin suppressor-like RCC1 family protein
LKNDGTVWAFGDNTYGQLGNGTNTGSMMPVKVPSLTGVVYIACGTYFSFAVKNDGTVWGWGYNAYGQLGNGANTDSNIPVQATGLTGVIAVSCGYKHSLALKNDGTVWSCGENLYGALGQGTNGTATNSSTFIKINTLSGVRAISAGVNHSHVVKNDGTVWCWGYNITGQVGNGTTTEVDAPVQISGLSGATAIASNDGNVIVLKTDGTTRTWGSNFSGEAGTGSATQFYYSPTQPTGLCTVLDVKEIEVASGIEVYPNPTNDKIKIKGIAQPNIAVFNIMGEKVVAAQNANEINLSELPVGLYMVQVYGKDMELLKSMKLVKE